MKGKPMDGEEKCVVLLVLSLILVLSIGGFGTCADTKRRKIEALQAGATPAEVKCLLEVENSESILCDRVFNPR